MRSTLDTAPSSSHSTSRDQRSRWEPRDRESRDPRRNPARLLTFHCLLLLTVLTACSFAAPGARPAIVSTASPQQSTATVAPTLTPIGMTLPTLPAIPTATLPTGQFPVPATAPRTATATRSAPAVVSPTPGNTPTRALNSASEFLAAGMRERQNGNYTRAAVNFQSALALAATPDVAREAQFRLAETHALAEDFEHAITALTTYLQSDPNGVHAPEANKWLADIYGKSRDDGSALAQLQTYRGETQALQGVVDAEIADALARSGNTAAALAHYDRALQDKNLPPRMRADIHLRLGSLWLKSGNAAVAAVTFDVAVPLALDAAPRALMNLYAGQAYAADGRMDLASARWNSVLTDNPDQPSAIQAIAEMTKRNIAVDDVSRGRVAYEAGNIDAALLALQRYVQRGGPRQAQAHYYLARSYVAQGTYVQAIAEYDRVGNSQPPDSLAADALMGKGAAYEALGEIDQAVAAFKHVPPPRGEEGLIRAGKALDGVKRFKDAAALFDLLPKTYPTAAPERLAEALFGAGLAYSQLPDYASASARWQTIVDQHTQSDYYTAALYWLGKTKMSRGQADAAKNDWSRAAAVTQEVFRSFRRNYYAYRARAALQPKPASGDPRLYDVARYAMDISARAELERWLVNWTKATNTRPGVLSDAVRADMAFRRGDEWYRRGDFGQAHVEFSGLVDAWEEDPLAMYALALYFEERGLYDFSIACAIRLYNLALEAGATPTPRALSQLRYPTYYADLVVAESRANGIDPRMFFALIRLESRFNSWVRGPAGERGLTQIGPHVAPSIATALQVRNLSMDQLDLPYLNLRFGGWLFSQNARQLSDPIYTFAAYNAGLPSAQRWQGGDVDLALEQFDYDSARDYVFIIYPYWQEYAAFYP